MKCFFAVAFLALVASTLAAPVADVPSSAPAVEKEPELVKSEDAKDARDKRGLLVTSYATAPISTPLAYSAYPALSAAAPIAYTSGLPVAHTSYVHSYPSYVSYNAPASYIVA